MCYGHHDHHRSLSPPSRRHQIAPARTGNNNNNNEAVVDDLRGRLAETEARLERARVREAELNRRLEEMKRFVSVMEILEGYLKRRFREQQDRVACLFSSSSSSTFPA